MLVRCGLESNGAPEFLPNGALRYPLHGKIANIPAHKVEVTIDGDSGEIAVTGVVDEARLFGNKLRMTTTISTQVGSSGLTVSDEITNLSAEPGELELLYHTNFGLPLLTPGAKVVLPVKKLAPRDAIAAENLPEWDVYGPETPGLGEACFFFDLAADASGQTQVLLRSAAGNQGREREVQQAPVALFHALEEPAGGGRRLCDRTGAGDQFPQPQIVRKGEGPGRHFGAGRDAPLRGFDRSPHRRCRGGRGRKSGRRAAGFSDAGDLPPARPAMVPGLGVTTSYATKRDETGTQLVDR